MAYPVSPYIYELNGGLYAVGSGVSLDSVVINYQQGASPAQIVESFPTLKLWQVFGVLAYYLEYERVIGEYVAEGQRKFEEGSPCGEPERPVYGRPACPAGGSPGGSALQVQMSIRFLADEDLKVGIVQGLRA